MVGTRDGNMEWMEWGWKWDTETEREWKQDQIQKREWEHETKCLASHSSIYAAP